MDFNTTFSKTELCTFLKQKGVEDDDAKKLLDEKVDGETFQDITEEDLKEIGVKLGTRKKIMKIIQNFKQSVLENGALQDLQILGGDTSLSNSLVFDLIAAGSSCTVLPAIASSTSISTSATCSSNAVATVSSTPPKTISRRNRRLSTTSKRSAITSSFLAELLPPEESKEPPISESDLCTNDATAQAIVTYSDPRNINVLAMLDEHMSGKTIMRNLKSGRGISRCDVNEIVRIVVRSMIDYLRTLYPTTTQKLNLAKAIVRDIPELKSNREGVAGYEQFYDPRNNSGSIEWRLKTLRLKIPADKKKYNRRGDPSKPANKNAAGEVEEEIEINDDDLEKIDWLKTLPTTEVNRKEIFQGMEETFNVRQNLILKKHASMSDILEGFPKFKDFDGALISADFKLIYPNAANVLEVLPDYSKRIIAYANSKRHDITERIGTVSDDNLKAMLYLADLCPYPGIRKRRLDDDRIMTHPSEDLIIFSDDNTIHSREQLSKFPRLLCCGEVHDELLQFFLVLDREFIDLGKCFIKAFDILYKSYKVFNVEYPKNLSIFYHFLDTMVYKVNTGVARSSIEHLNNILCCINV